MGSSNSKPRSNEALTLCKERTQYIKQAIDLRFNLSASHLSYTQSLLKFGSSLRQFTESQLSLNPNSLSTQDVEKSPSHSSHGETESPLNGETESPFKPSVSYMKNGGGNTVVTVTVNPSALGSTNKDSDNWDYFEQNANQSEGLKQSKESETESVPFIEEREEETEKEELEREICEEELITHRAKEFLASVKDLENRFVRASEAGNELAKMLETNKIRLSVCTVFPSGKPSASSLILAFNQVCFRKETLLKQDYTQQVSKVITWNRALSSISSPSRENEDERNHEFIEQFSMISGSHSSTLDRLYAWEKKLYDEIKASECIRKAYDHKCSLLRQQFASDMKAQSIDKTRSIIKDLHSRLCVSIQAVDSISKRIERMRDEELQPQLVELTHEMIKMWRSMLECHHSQFITISLAYHVKRPNVKTEGQNENLTHLLEELDSFASNFANWINSQRNYIQALDSWLQKCVLQPQERRRGRRKAIFPPPQALSPPIFVLCKDWLNGIKALPLDELLESIRAVGLVLRDEFERRENEESYVRGKEMERFQSGLRGLFDKLNKFAEASLKVCEEVKHAHEVARVAYKMVESGDISINSITSRVSL